MLRGWKLNYVEINGDGHGSVDLEIGDDYISIPVYPNKDKKQKYDRARVKREYKKRIDEELEREW